MASSSSSCFSSSSPSPLNQDTNTQITPQELFAFHNIDRQLFSRLVFNLRREPSEAMHAAAFWLWLERFNNTARYVDAILTVPDQLLEAVLEETLLCLRAAEADDEPGAGGDFRPHEYLSVDIPMIQRITGMQGISPRFFQENRIVVLLGVGKIVQQVCLRAFQDLIQMLLANRGAPHYNYYYQHEPSNEAAGPENPNGGTNIGINGGTGAGGGGGGGGGVTGSGLFAPQNSPPWSFFSQDLGHEMVYYPNFGFSFDMAPPQGGSPSNGGGYGDPGASASNGTPNPGLITIPIFHNPNFDPGMSYPQATPEDDLVEMLGRIHLDNHHQIQGLVEDRVVPTSERTIFLTFSKGYPISEIELRDFLSRSFGDIVEALYMQEVGENEQPLYARLVVPNLSAMEALLGGQSKAKFSINGKHVWARKYVRKNNPNSPPSSPI